MRTNNSHRLCKFALMIGASDARASEAERAKKLELFRSRDGNVFADPYEGAIWQTWPAQSKFFSQWLARTYFEITGRIAPPGQLKAAINLIEARAQGGVPEHEVFLRIGEHAGRVYLDLADESWSAVEIDACRAEVVSPISAHGGDVAASGARARRFDRHLCQAMNICFKMSKSGNVGMSLLT